MSAQASTETAEAPLWSALQGAVINGSYPLHRLVHGSQRSAVFLTEYKGQATANAALKIIPIERVTLAQLAHWRSATELSHPHLIQLFDAGLCQLAGRQFLFVVMEYAEQTLAEVLGRRTLTPEEVRELLPPTLEALAFLHREGLVQGHLTPANVLVVNDQVKLASDSIRPAGAPRMDVAEPSFYDPPQTSDAPFSSADDIWGFGVMLVEALTQFLPWRDEPSDAACLPTTLPAEFLDTVQRCLSDNPATRPSATELEVQFGLRPPAVVLAAAPVLQVAPQVAPTRELPSRLGRMPVVTAIVFLILLATVWADLRLFRSPASSQSTSDAARLAAQRAAAVPPNAAQNPARPAGPAAIHEQMPNVSRSALGTIRGHIKISVLVVVDQAGMVIEAHLKNTGPSGYFARLTREAAGQWTFTPADVPGTRKWLLRFEFTRGGVTGAATPGS